jgi:hypothetical protein
MIAIPLACARGVVSEPRLIGAACLCPRRGGARNENPGGLFSSPGFGTSCLTLSSGRPIGEPRLNDRYRDNDAYYNDVENKPAGARFRLTAIDREIERAIETTIGHSIFQSEEMSRLNKQAGAV